jgi:hypothetical protein
MLSSGRYRFFGIAPLYLEIGSIIPANQTDFMGAGHESIPTPGLSNRD